MKTLNNKGYLTIEIILAAVIAFTIAFFLIEISINFSNASDNYYTDTIFITDKSLVSNNVKKKIENDINENGIITDVSCNNDTYTCKITYQNNSEKELKYNSSNKKVEYDNYGKEVKNLTIKSINVYGSFNDGDYIRFVISFDNVFNKNYYDINILIKNEENITYEVLVDHIIDLYDNSDKSNVNNNGIQYRYATDANLMNDRLGDANKDIDGGNIRYYGKSPNNYVDIGDRTSDNKVSLWRIIGVFDGKVRIIRDGSIGLYSWKSSASNINNGHGINEWSISDVMKLINPDYSDNQDLNSSNETITVNNSLWWDRDKGKCHRGTNNTTVDCDFTSLGLSKSISETIEDERKRMVVDQEVFLGGIYASDSATYPNDAYKRERGTDVFNNTKSCYGQSLCNDTVTRTLKWTGKVTIIYPSDYGYAADLNLCKVALQAYNNDNCKNNNWMYTTYPQWTITPVSSIATTVWRFNGDGRFANGQELSYGGHIRPIMTLSPDLLVKSTDEGTKESPYVVIKP